MSTPIRVLIVDDEELGRERIRQLLEQEAAVEIVGECEDGIQAVEALERLHPDLVFLDVQMPRLDGLGVLQRFGAERVPEVIFTTAHIEYMERAFEIHALDYLRKPLSEARFRRALEHARQRIAHRRGVPQTSDPRIRALLAELAGGLGSDRLRIVEKSGELRFLPIDDVLWLEAEGDLVRVHTRKDSIIWRTTLTQAEATVDPAHFLRVHRSSIVNTRKVRRVVRIGKGEFFFELEGGRKIGTGRTYREAVEAFLNG